MQFSFHFLLFQILSGKMITQHLSHCHTFNREIILLVTASVPPNDPGPFHSFPFVQFTCSQNQHLIQWFLGHFLLKMNILRTCFYCICRRKVNGRLLFFKHGFYCPIGLCNNVLTLVVVDRITWLGKNLSPYK